MQYIAPSNFSKSSEISANSLWRNLEEFKQKMMNY